MKNHSLILHVEPSVLRDILSDLIINVSAALGSGPLANDPLTVPFKKVQSKMSELFLYLCRPRSGPLATDHPGPMQSTLRSRHSKQFQGDVSSLAQQTHSTMADNVLSCKSGGKMENRGRSWEK